MNVKNLAAGSLLLVCATSAPLFAQQYSDDDLIRMGNDAWQQKPPQCVKVGQFLFAYLLRNPAPVRADPGYRARLQSAIRWCDQNTAVFADSKGDKQGRGGSAQQPNINLAPQPSAQASSGVQKRCDIYATIAVAQKTANVANRCRTDGNGNRWNPSYDFHYQYCLTAQPPTIFAETQTRQNLLWQCAP